MNLDTRVLLNLLARFEAGCRFLGARRPLSPELNSLTLASLLLINENLAQLRTEEAVVPALCQARDALTYLNDCSCSGVFRYFSEYEKLPYGAAIALLQDDFLALGGAAPLLRGISHAKTDIRGWCMQIAWMLRNHLPHPDTLEILFHNLVQDEELLPNTLGLARAIVESDESFFSRLEAFERATHLEPEFHDKLEQIKEKQLLPLSVLFWQQQEQVCRLVIDETAVLL